MKYWKVSLLREGRCARQWHVRAEVLTVGSHGSNKVHLPPPVEAFALQVADSTDGMICEVGPYTLRIEDETRERSTLWSEARVRVDHAISAASEAPREAPVPVRAAIAAFALLGLTNLAGSLVVDGKPHVLREYERNRAARTARPPSPAVAPEPRYEAPTAAPSPDLEAPRERAFSTLAANPSPSGKTVRLAALVGQFPSSPVAGHGPSWDGALMANGADLAVPSPIPAAWLASPPERYRAPWPDAPVPPH